LRKRKYYTPDQAAELLGVGRDVIETFIERELLDFVRRRGDLVLPLEQVERAKVACTLSEELGVNLAGVEVALHLRDKLISQQEAMLEFVDRMMKMFNEEIDRIEKGLDRDVLDGE